jgi:hypothetical protein
MTRRGIGRGSALILIALLALLATGLTLRQAVDQQWAITQPDRAAQAWPASATVLGQLSIRRVLTNQGVVDDKARAMAAQALTLGPNEAMPVAIAALDASAFGDLVRARRLMELARLRDPRLPMVRVWLLNDDARRGDYAALLGEVGPVMRLLPETREQVYAMLSRLEQQPGSARILARVLAEGPDWSVPYRQWLASGKGDRPIR